MGVYDHNKAGAGEINKLVTTNDKRRAAQEAAAAQFNKGLDKRLGEISTNGYVDLMPGI